MQAAGLKIVIIGPYPLHDGKVVGGVEAVTNTLATALSAEEAIAQVTVLRFHTGQVASRRTQVNEKLHVWYLRGQAHLRVLTRTFWEARIARRAVGELAPHVIHGQGIGSHGDVATQLRGTPVITVHGLVHREARLGGRDSLKDRVRNEIIDARTKQVLARAKAVISISNYDAQAVAGLVRGQHRIIPNPISPEFFQLRPQAPATQHVLFAGVLARRKNVEGLVRAFALTRRALPQARLRIVGPAPDGDYAREIRSQVQASNLDGAVDFVGHVENERLLHEIQACQVVALFSHEETSPTILAQAMALRKPIAASRVGGIGEMVIDGESGLLATPGDERTFAEQLVTLLRSPELCQQMGERGHEIAWQQFEPSAIARRTVEVYQHVKS